ncbi:MAG TPA: class I SAM-dependent methyltransferase [Candidatus Binataceae bacterium]|nr:class I SAM-dependent methyltransferase [Candidatus Binataceae bacterium]
MAENYRFRPPYSREVYDTLLGLIRDQPRVVLDAGCGPGKIAREIVSAVDRIDAVDPSAEMIRVGRAQPGGADRKINWICDRVETATLRPPYALVVAGASFHWMNPEVALTRFSEAISQEGMFAVLDGDTPVGQPWAREEQDLMIEMVTEADGVRPKWWATMEQRLSEPLIRHPQFALAGSRVTAPMEVNQSIADYLISLHSRAACSEQHLGEELAHDFDLKMSRLLSRYLVGGILTYQVKTRIDWGRPLPA